MDFNSDEHFHPSQEITGAVNNKIPAAGAADDPQPTAFENEEHGGSDAADEKCRKVVKKFFSTDKV